MRKIGIYGGSFNPIHRGHIALARQFIRQGVCDEVWLMVTPLNPFKQGSTELAADDIRLQLARKALSRQPHIHASDFEFSLPKPSYTWQTLQALSQHYPDATFTLLIGADNWQGFAGWYHSEDILNHYAVAVYPRKGCPVDAATLPPQVTLVDAPLYNVSSSEIRRRVRQGLPLGRMVPAAIRADVIAVYS